MARSALQLFVPVLYVLCISKAVFTGANKVPGAAADGKLSSVQYFTNVKTDGEHQQFYYQPVNSGVSPGNINKKSRGFLYDYLPFHYNHTNDIISSKLGLVDQVSPTPTLTSAIGNALGVAGLGFLISKELAVALNTPITIPFTLIPALILAGFALLFPNIGSLLPVN